MWPHQLKNNNNIQLSLSRCCQESMISSVYPVMLIKWQKFFFLCFNLKMWWKCKLLGSSSICCCCYYQYHCVERLSLTLCYEYDWLNRGMRQKFRDKKTLSSTVHLLPQQRNRWINVGSRFTEGQKINISLNKEKSWEFHSPETQKDKDIWYIS